MDRKNCLIVIFIFFRNLFFSKILESASSNTDLIPNRINLKWGFSNSNEESKITVIYSENVFFLKLLFCKCCNKQLNAGEL